jgi:hypothetical protein
MSPFESATVPPHRFWGAVLARGTIPRVTACCFYCTPLEASCVCTSGLMVEQWHPDRGTSTGKCAVVVLLLRTGNCAELFTRTVLSASSA